MDILKYETDIWASADCLYSSGKKQSEFPNFMMPYFALRLVESRLIREKERYIEEYGLDPVKDIDTIDSLIQDSKCGYNKYIIHDGKKLFDITRNDKTFARDFDEYLTAFDDETKHLLGIDIDNKDETFLNLTGIMGQLRAKSILFDFTQKWANIDLQPFSNSEITTLEEHIKRKWADMQADTAGEQFTPDDIISLISEIAEDKIDRNSGKALTIYDPTCGGGNLLFGIEDRFCKNSNLIVSTFGMDNNSTLYALAKIESRFREDSTIEYGNTLTSTIFDSRHFDLIVANPPYGSTWKSFAKDIEKDKTGRFHALPSVSDSQMLFDQHIASYMNENNGLAIIVNNGSPFFSGDAGSGESNIRKYFIDNDWVEAIIQMPDNEFFNTGIFTYLWVLNRNKAPERKDKIILINGSSLFENLKKSKGDKRHQMNAEHRATIVNALHDFKDSPISKVFDKYFCYYNKYGINLFKVDDHGKSFCDFDEVGKPLIKKQKINAVSFSAIVNGEKVSYGKTTFYIDDIAPYTSFEDFKENCLLPALNTDTLSVCDDTHSYSYFQEENTLQQLDLKTGEVQGIGNGTIIAKVDVVKEKVKKTKKETTTIPEHIEIKFTLQSDTQTDYEIIPFSIDEQANQANIDSFMEEYVTRPWTHTKTTIGTEINFNKIFYIPEVLRPVDEILSEINDTDKTLNDLISDFSL